MKKIYFCPSIFVYATDTCLIMDTGSLEKTEGKADKGVDVLAKDRDDFDEDEEEAFMMMQSEQTGNSLW